MLPPPRTYLVDEPIDDGGVEIVAAQVGVTGRGNHLHEAPAHLRSKQTTGTYTQR